MQLTFELNVSICLICAFRRSTGEAFFALNMAMSSSTDA